MTRLDTHRVITVPDEWFAEHLQVDRWPGSGPARHVVIDEGRAMPQDAARAADASHSSLLRVSTRGGITIAALCIIYFVAEFLR